MTAVTRMTAAPARRRIRAALFLLASMPIVIGLENCMTAHLASVPPRKAAEMLSADPQIVRLDVRTREEYDGELGHLAGAILIPVQELQARIGELDSLKGRTIMVYCRSGRRSVTASEILRKHGHSPVNVEGGMLEWNNLGLQEIERRP